MIHRSAPAIAAFAALLMVTALDGAAGQSPAQAQAAPAAETGTVLVQVNPPASVYLDGKLVTATSAEHRVDAATGLRLLRIIHPDYQDLVRTLRIGAGQTTTLRVSLAVDGVRKTPAAARARGATGRGATGRVAPVGAAAPLDADLARGIEFVKLGDFPPALDTLFAVTKNLSGVPRMIGQQAQAFLYLGIALLELNQVEQAKIWFAMAQRADRTLAPKPTEFSPRTLRAWEEARAVPADAEPEDPSAINPTTTPAARPDASAAPVDRDDAEFIVESDSHLEFDVAVATGGRPCSGRLTIDRDQKSVGWSPNADGCTPAFAVPFDDVRSPVTAPRGGVLLQFRSGRPSIVVMPAPDADLLEPDVDKMTVGELPASTRVHIRRTERRITEALGRSYDARLNGLVVYVPIADLIENPSDYDGGSVRTSGKLTASPTKGAYLLTDENAAVHIAASGAAVQLLRSRANEWINKELIVTGAFSRPKVTPASAKGAPPAAFAITATRIEPAAGVKYQGAARSVTLEELFKDPPRGKELVRVVGRYRGTNSYGDLPIESRRDGTDWVIKDQLYAIWVTGRPASGKGFALDASSQIDRESSWVAVTGTVEERKGFVYIRASDLELLPASENGRIRDPRLQTGARNSRPDIIYTDPIEGKEEMALDQQLLIQFSKAMDETTFASRVQLRYTDGAAATFRYLSVTYYPDRNRSVIIDPGAALKAGRTLECVLLPGIKDVDGQELSGTEVPGGRVLKWTIRPAR